MSRFEFLDKREIVVRIRDVRVDEKGVHLARIGFELRETWSSEWCVFVDRRIDLSINGKFDQVRGQLR